MKHEGKISKNKGTIVSEVSDDVRQQAFKYLKERLQNPKARLQLINRIKQSVNQIKSQSKSRETK